MYSKKIFFLDVEQKDNVLCLRTSDDTIVGFTSFNIFNIAIFLGHYTVFYSGDTVIDEPFRGASGNILHACCMEHSLKAMLENSQQPCVWYLASCSYLSYKLITKYFLKYYPSPFTKTPDLEKKVIAELSANIHKDFKFTATGDPLVLEFSKNWAHVDSNKIPPPREKDEIANFFTQVNPRWAEGLDLPCIGYIDEKTVEHMFKKLNAQNRKTDASMMK